MVPVNVIPASVPSTANFVQPPTFPQQGQGAQPAPSKPQPSVARGPQAPAPPVSRGLAPQGPPAAAQEPASVQQGVERPDARTENVGPQPQIPQQQPQGAQQQPQRVPFNVTRTQDGQTAVVIIIPLIGTNPRPNPMRVSVAVDDGQPVTVELPLPINEQQPHNSATARQQGQTAQHPRGQQQQQNQAPPVAPPPQAPPQAPPPPSGPPPQVQQQQHHVAHQERMIPPQQDPRNLQYDNNNLNNRQSANLVFQFQADNLEFHHRHNNRLSNSISRHKHKFPCNLSEFKFHNNPNRSEFRCHNNNNRCFNQRHHK